MKTGKMLIEEFGGALTLRKLELWVKKGYLQPERGSRGRGLAHTYADRDVRKIRHMLEQIGKGLLPEEACRVAETKLQEEDKPFVLAIEPDLVSRRILRAALEPICRSEITDSVVRARGWLRLPRHPDLLILEPRIEKEASRQLLVDALQSQIPVLVSSVRLGGLPRGTGFIQKPYRMFQLRARVTAILKLDQ